LFAGICSGAELLFCPTAVVSVGAGFLPHPPNKKIPPAKNISSRKALI
jgi:hypothetical protein